MDNSLELAKLSVSALGLVLAIVVVNGVFSLVKHWLGKKEQTNTVRTAGEMPREHYDNRFDKIDDKMDGITEILGKVTEILGDIRDWMIEQKGEQRGRRSNGDI